MTIDREQPIEVQREIAKGEVKKMLEDSVQYLMENIKEEATSGERSRMVIPKTGLHQLEVRNLNLTDAELKKAGEAGDYGRSFRFIKIEPVKERAKDIPSYYIGAKNELGEKARKGLQYSFSETVNGEVTASLPYPEHQSTTEKGSKLDKELLGAVPDKLRDFRTVLESFIKAYTSQ